MINMLKNFVNWFIVFGLSFLVSDVFHWTQQGRAFLYIHIGALVIFVVILTLVLLIAGVAFRAKLLATGISFLLIGKVIIGVAIVLLATWGATKLFKIDFFVAYQIMTFGTCLVTKREKKNDEDSENKIKITF